jgi:hypothetical protein
VNLLGENIDTIKNTDNLIGASKEAGLEMGKSAEENAWI